MYSKDTQTDSFGRFLCEIGRYPLLTAAQEVDLGRQLAIVRGIEKLPEGLTQEQQAAALGLSMPELQRQLDVAVRARSKFVAHNLRFVVNIATKYQNRGLTLEELVQEGTLGLNRAAEKFDPERGWKFSTYAYWWIRQAMTRATQEKSTVICLPIHIWEAKVKINKQVKKAAIAGKVLDIQGLSEATGLSPDKVQRALDSFRIATPVSLNVRIGENGDSELGDLIQSQSSELSPVESACSREQTNAIKNAFKILSDRERIVIEMRFGLDDGVAKTLDEIARVLDCSRERVRQLQNKALRKIRNEPRVMSKLRGVLES